MRWLRDERDWGDLLGTPNAILFIFVEWSTYAARGLEIFEEGERMATQNLSCGDLTWWAGDFSSIPSKLDIVVEWLRDEQTRGGVVMFPAIGSGNGSVVWIHRGKVVNFAMSTSQLGADGLLHISQSKLDNVRSDD